MPGPNDFHGEIINGVWTICPGLGDHEPKTAESRALAAEPPKTQELRRREAAVERVEEELRVRADKLAAREKALASFAEADSASST